MLDMPVSTIPEGEYLIGDSKIAISRPLHPVQLAGFALAESPVTNAHYVAFIDAGGYQARDYWTEAGWRWLEARGVEHPPYLMDRAFNHPYQPIVAVSWYEAAAFARWYGAQTQLPWRLPSEAEWEAAARGPHDDSPRPRIYNTAELGLGRTWAITHETNVSWCGARDLLGNVWEWTCTRWGKNWQTLEYRYPYHSGDGREEPEGSHARVMRGGSWFDPLAQANPAHRARYLPGSRGSNIGFRLARSL